MHSKVTAKLNSEQKVYSLAEFKKNPGIYKDENELEEDDFYNVYYVNIDNKLFLLIDDDVSPLYMKNMDRNKFVKYRGALNIELKNDFEEDDD
jgi:hypothetical protein